VGVVKKRTPCKTSASKKKPHGRKKQKTLFGGGPQVTKQTRWGGVGTRKQVLSNKKQSAIGIPVKKKQQPEKEKKFGGNGRERWGWKKNRELHEK